MQQPSVRILVPMPEGVEEMEITIIVDVLRRAGLGVVTAGLPGRQIRASRGMVLVADTEWSDVDISSFDVLILPGGAPGTRLLMQTPGILAAVRQMIQTDKWVGAICAGPLVLQAAGVLKGRRITCHPAVAGDIHVTCPLSDPVVEDGRLITSRGPGTAFRFALQWVTVLQGKALANRLAAEMVLSAAEVG